jgi:hypothetical protein
LNKIRNSQNDKLNEIEALKEQADQKIGLLVNEVEKLRLALIDK